MALIEKIRSRGKLVVVVVLLALASFVLGDFFSGNSSIRQFFTSNGEADAPLQINGKNIEQSVFTAYEKQLSPALKLQYGDESNPEYRKALKQAVVQQVYFDNLSGKEFEKLGLSVTDDELKDMFYGANYAPELDRYFPDSTTQKYNPALFDQFKKDAKRKPLLIKLENEFAMNRIMEKYQTVFSKSVYTTKSEALRNFARNNTTANARLVAKSYTTVADSTIKVTDEDLKKYYDTYSYQFKQNEETRTVKYALINIAPSAEDRGKLKTEMEPFVSILNSTNNPDSLEAFINEKSENGFSVLDYKKGTYPTIETELGTVPGAVYGPFENADKMILVKFFNNKEFTDSVKAKHILISSKTKATADARKDLDSLKLKIQNGMPFGLAAMQYSEDPGSKVKGGDLGFFAKGMMVPEFDKACFEGKVGDMVIVETQFGVHLIQIDAKKVSNKPAIAVIEKSMVASSKTTNELISKINLVAAAKTADEFEKLAKEKGLMVADQQNINKNSKAVGMLQDARTFVSNIFKAKLNEVVTPEPIGTSYATAFVTSIKEKGIPKFESMKADLKAPAIKEKKAEKLIAELKAAGNTLEAISAKLGLPVDSANSININSYGLPKYGAEPAVIGRISGSAVAKVSQPIKGANGVYVYVVDAVNTKEAVPTTPEAIKQLQKDANKTQAQVVGNKIGLVLTQKSNLVNNLAQFNLIEE
jgi:peptidyl-prolyl cis-trans isomerase D